jgi:hypothetical protein
MNFTDLNQRAANAHMKSVGAVSKKKSGRETAFGQIQSCLMVFLDGYQAQGGK